MELRQAASQADIPDTKDSVYQFFTGRVTRNLHIVLTLSPAGGKFRQRCRMNPAFVNCCTIDWYDEWEEEAMLSVAEVFFENAEFIADESYDLKASGNSLHQKLFICFPVFFCIPVSYSYV